MYTEADYKRRYEELEKQEQESNKAYSTWLMQMKMAIQTYNSIVTDNQLEEQFPLLASSDEAIDSMDMEHVRTLYNKVMGYRNEIACRIEQALGMTPSQPIDTVSTVKDTTVSSIAFNTEPVSTPEPIMNNTPLDFSEVEEYTTNACGNPLEE